jgi:hypothetical protein
MTYLIFLIIIPAALAGGGWLAWRFWVTDGAKRAVSKGDWGIWQVVLDLKPLVWVHTRWYNSRKWLRSVVLRISWLRRLAIALGFLEDWETPAAARDTVPQPAEPLPPLPAAPPVIPPADIPDHLADPGEVAAVMGSPIPPDHAAAIGRIAGFEPEDDAAWLAFMQGEAAAFIGYAEAWRSQADVCLNSVGMDPAAVQGTIELADVVGDNAHDVTLARRRFLVTYAATLEQIASGLVLPFRAREWLTGEGA